MLESKQHNLFTHRPWLRSQTEESAVGLCTDQHPRTVHNGTHNIGTTQRNIAQAAATARLHTFRSSDHWLFSWCTFTATSRSSTRSRAFQTSLKPPRPSKHCGRYLQRKISIFSEVCLCEHTVVSISASHDEHSKNVACVSDHKKVWCDRGTATRKRTAKTRNTRAVHSTPQGSLAHTYSATAAHSDEHIPLVHDAQFVLVNLAALLAVNTLALLHTLKRKKTKIL
jgi:hypothetical protein